MPMWAGHALQYARRPQRRRIGPDRVMIGGSNGDGAVWLHRIEIGADHRMVQQA